MKFYISTNIFKIPDNKRAVDIKTCGDDQFKTEIEISYEDFEYYFYTKRGDLFLNSVKEKVEEIMSTIVERITEEIKSELKSKVGRKS
jgi:hypothetical protein